MEIDRSRRNWFLFLFHLTGLRLSISLHSVLLLTTWECLRARGSRMPLCACLCAAENKGSGAVTRRSGGGLAESWKLKAARAGELTLTRGNWSIPGKVVICGLFAHSCAFSNQLVSPVAGPAYHTVQMAPGLAHDKPMLWGVRCTAVHGCKLEWFRKRGHDGKMEKSRHTRQGENEPEAVNGKTQAGKKSKNRQRPKQRQH